MADTDTKQPRAKFAKNGRKPRIVLTEGAIFDKDKMHDSVTLAPEGEHQICRFGDLVMLTDEEFDLHRSNGVCLADQKQAAE